MKKHEDEIVKQKHESAVVVMKSGEVYRVDGVKDRVYPDYVFEDELIGSSITHNHPIEETTFFFSKDDLMLFERLGLRLLRQVDEQYISELDRSGKEVDAVDFDAIKDGYEAFEHYKIARAGIRGGYGYKRIKR